MIRYISQTLFFIFPHICPKLVYSQAIIVFSLRLYGIDPRSKDFEHLGESYIEDDADVPYADSPYQHDFYEISYTGKASPIAFFMIADKLTPTVFTEIMLGAVVFFPVSDYVTPWHWGI
jgi:hypothetical protein